jgi:hypothetical protein
MATLSDTSQTRRELRGQSRFVRFTGGASEIMLTVGVLSGLFLSWHLVLNDMIRGEAQGQAARDVAQEWSPRLWWKLPLLCPPTVSPPSSVQHPKEKLLRCYPSPGLGKITFTFDIPPEFARRGLIA